MEEYTVEQLRDAARRAMEAGNVSAAEELAQAGIALQQQLRSRPAPPRDNPHPPVVERATPVSERAQMEANMLPPGTNPDTIPRQQPGVDPSAMPPVATSRRIPERSEAIFETENGGVVYRQQGGDLGFVSPNFSTTDPATIMQILRGQHPGTAERGVNQAMVEANPASARVATAIQGVPFVGSYLDEVAGAAFGPESAASVTRLQDAYAESNPTGSALWRAGGMVAGAVPMVAAAAPSAAPAATTRGAQMVATGLRGALAGGAEGAIYGAGDQSGAGRVSNAATNAIVGTALGGVAGAALSLLDRGIAQATSQYRNASADVIQNELQISPQAAAVIQRALRADDPAEAMRRIAARGDDAMLADAGQAGSTLLNTAVAEGGQAGTLGRNAVESRVVRQNEALQGILNETLGEPQGQGSSLTAIRTGTAAERRELYDAAYSQPVDYSSGAGRRIETLLQRVDPAAIRAAQRLMRAEGEDSAQIMARIGDDGTVTFTQMPDVRQLHYIMQGIGEAANREQGAGALGGTSAVGRSMENLRRQLGDALSETVPEFGAAQSRFADIAAERRATELGYDLFRSTRDEVTTAMRGATDAERAAARLGARNYLEDEIDRIAAIASDPNMDARQLRELMSELTSNRSRANLRTILGAQDADRLIAGVDEAMGALQLRAAIARNSDTHIRQVTREAINAETAPQILESLVSGLNIRDAGRQFVQVFTGNSAEAQALRSQAMMTEISRALTEIRGPSAQRALRNIQTAMAGETLTPSEAELIGAVLARNAAVLGHQEGLQALEVR